MTRKLYLRLYLALLASGLGCLLLVAVAFRVARNAAGPPGERAQHAAERLAETLADIDAVDAQQHLARIAGEFQVDIVAGDDRGPRIGIPSARAFPVPRGGAPNRARQGPVALTAIGDTGWAALRARPAYRPLRMHPFSSMLVLLAVVLAVGSFPVARRLARRLETLAHEMKQWGEGDRQRRAQVVGSDEVAQLAATFNQAAARVDALLEQQKQLLANASHELRSPLARLRMGLELIAEQADPARRRAQVEAIHRDIVELDALIEEVLLFARADGRTDVRPLVSVDLRELVAEEAAHIGATVDGPKVTITADAVMVRHLVRNLLENARRHGGGAVTARVSADSNGATLAVADEGPGIPAEDQERIFAPFFRATKPGTASPGHGLGLALVRQVARFHGGDATYVAREAGGGQFQVTFPRRPVGGVPSSRVA